MTESVDTLSEPPVLGTSSLENGDGASKLADLIAQATLKYSLKDYNAAAELYSYAVELQDEINGEMSLKNADLLYVYGRCLYHVAVKKSDVLGSKVAGEKKEEGSKKKSNKKAKQEKVPEALEPEDKKIAEDVVAQVVEKKNGDNKEGGDAEKADKPYFQFTGDENWDTSDEEEDEAEDDGEGDEDADEEDDFSNAYEVLDMARVLLQKKIAEDEKFAGKGRATEEPPEAHQLKERLADTFDLQAEISLEGERFPNAVIDLRSALELKEKLFPQESSLLAEAHYKLSLALEFSSVTQQKNSNGEVEQGSEAQVDYGMREEAAQEMEAAISSCRSRIAKEEAKIHNGTETNGIASKLNVKKADIDDVKDMVKEMELRLVELRQPPVSINDPTGTGSLDGSNPLSGILGQILGESPAAQNARLEEASKTANDLTGMVKRKKPVDANRSPKTTEKATPQTNGKRKVDFAEDAEEVGTGKKVKIADGDEK